VPPDRPPSSYIGKRDPSGMTLTYGIGFASLALSVERIEFLLEAVVGLFSGVDRAADSESRVARDHPAPWPALALEVESSCRRLRPKNRRPGQCVPVIFRATRERER
jgi:hypothetical protein